MKIRIGCIDGHTYVSDNVPNEEIQELLDQAEGRIGSGAWEDVVISTPAEFAEFMDALLKDKKGPDGMPISNFTLVMEGRDRHFNPAHIVWHEIQVG